MAANVNKVIIIGNLGAKPELNYTKGGTAVTTLSVATNERWSGQDGEKNERTEWHRIVVFGRTAENCCQYLDKGRSIYAEGRLATRDWEDKDGNKRYTTEIVANTIQFLSGDGGGGGGGYSDDGGGSGPPSRGGGGGGGGARSSGGGGGARQSGGGGGYEPSFEDDDIPF